MTPHSPNHSLRSGPHRRQNPIAGLPGSIRRGSVLTLMAFMLPVLIILSAFAINIAHMQVSRAELIVATDAAARAAGRSFSEHQSVDEARSYAHVTAAQHHVDGSRLEIDPEQLSYLEFGQTSQPDGPDGRFIFHPVPTAQVVSGAVFASAVRVHGRRNDGSITGRIPLLFPAFMAIEDYEMVTSAVALQVDRDISLVVDRSGSMSDTSFAFPSGSNPFSWDNLWEGVDAGVLERRNGSFYYADGVTPYDYKAWAWEELFELGTPPLKPWDALTQSVEAFLEVLADTPQNEQVSLASYSTSATLDTYLESDYDVVVDTVNSLQPTGWTAIGEGMQEGIETLIHENARPYAAKTMVVMTDGNHNRGTAPADVAQTLMNQYDMVITTVTFGAGADQATMQEVASIGQGRHYHANTGEELINIYREIANNLPTIISQ